MRNIYLDLINESSFNFKSALNQIYNWYNDDLISKVKLLELIKEIEELPEQTVEITDVDNLKNGEYYVADESILFKFENLKNEDVYSTEILNLDSGEFKNSKNMFKSGINMNDDCVFRKAFVKEIEKIKNFNKKLKFNKV